MATIPTPAEIQEQEMHISDDATPSIIAATAVCYTIACVAIALRFLSRRMAKIKYEADDWLVVAGLVRHLAFPFLFSPIYALLITLVRNRDPLTDYF